MVFANSEGRDALGYAPFSRFLAMSCSFQWCPPGPGVVSESRGDNELDDNRGVGSDEDTPGRRHTVQTTDPVVSLLGSGSLTC